MEKLKITETLVVEKIKEFLINKQNGNWHEEKSRISNLHEHSADIIMTGGNLIQEKKIQYPFDTTSFFLSHFSLFS